MGRATASLARAGTFVRAHGPRAGLELLANFVLPFAIYVGASPGLGPARALMAASAPPLLWSVAAFVRERRVDAIALVVLAGIALSLLAFAGGGGVRMLQLRENLVGGLVGIVFLGSAAIGRPLIHALTRAGMRRRAAHRVEAFDALSKDGRFRGDMTTATLVWGAGLLAGCAINCALVFALPIRTFLLVSPVVGYGAVGLLTAWTIWFVPRAFHAAEARLSPERSDSGGGTATPPARR